MKIITLTLNPAFDTHYTVKGFVPFTENYADLLVGVNIGGAGTLIASLASLITFREYANHNPKKVGYYIGVFSAFNFAFLLILIAFTVLTKLI